MRLGPLLFKSPDQERQKGRITRLLLFCTRLLLILTKSLTLSRENDQMPDPNQISYPGFYIYRLGHVGSLGFFGALQVSNSSGELEGLLSPLSGVSRRAALVSLYEKMLDKF